LREREMVKSAFARYVSRQVMDSVLSSGRSPVLHGDRCKVTVLFCDVRGFTSLSENMPPEEVVLLLNEYFEHMVDAIMRHGGTLDKFLGDGLMALFGAPLDDPYQEEHAIRAALEMQACLAKLSEKRQREGRLPISVGIGINSGPAIVGNIGASERMDYTAIGDTVNLASRLETATRALDASILISEYTYTAVRGKFVMRRIGPVTVKGRTDQVIVYAVEGESVGSSVPGAS
jgi:adenylate cyclase